MIEPVTVDLQIDGSNVSSLPTTYNASMPLSIDRSIDVTTAMLEPPSVIDPVNESNGAVVVSAEYVEPLIAVLATENALPMTLNDPVTIELGATDKYKALKLHPVDRRYLPMSV